MDQTFPAAPQRYLGPTESELSDASSYLAWELDLDTYGTVPLHSSASAYALAGQKLPVVLSRIQKLAAENDALALYGQLQLFDAFQRMTKNAEETFGSNALIEFYGGIVASLPETSVLDHVGRHHDLEVFFDLDYSLREFGRLELLSHIAKMRATPPGGRYEKIRQYLKLENKFDRMQGYVPMLRLIASAVLDPLTDESYKELGFALRDAVAAADALVEIQEFTALRARDRAYSKLSQNNTEQQSRDAFFDALKDGAPRLERDLPQMLASYAGFDPNQARTLLNAMSTTVGSQAPITSLEDQNKLRRRPIIKLADGRMIWGKPVDFCHVALDWAYEVTRDKPSLLRQLDVKRQKGVENLATEALVGVFGDSRVQTRVTYPAEGQPDIDVLVTLPDALLIVEVKGGRVTDPARRGADGRVKKKLAEFIDTAKFQNCRAWGHIKSQRGGFKDRFGRCIDSPYGTIAISVVVTLDRVDPFYSQSLEVENSGPTDLPQVLVSLADLLMLTDILKRPHELFSYLHSRGSLASSANVIVFTEADALGTWCERRFESLARHSSSEPKILSSGNAPLNEHYKFYGSSDETPAPTPGILAQVAAHLEFLLDVEDLRWPELCLEVGCIEPSSWAQVMRTLTKFAGIGAFESRPRKTRKRLRNVQTDGIRVGKRLRVIPDMNSAGEIRLSLSS